MSRKKSNLYINRSRYDEKTKEIEKTTGKKADRETMANICGLSKRQLEKILSKSSNVPIQEHTLRKMGEYLECSPGWLCSDNSDASSSGELLDTLDTIRDSRFPPLVDYLIRAGVFRSDVAKRPEYLLAAMDKDNTDKYSVLLTPETPEHDFFGIGLQYAHYGDLLKGAESIPMDGNAFHQYIKEIEAAVRYVTDRFIANMENFW